MTRIIAGSARGRRLRTPRGQATRPTSDRVREALFSSLDAELGSWAGVRVLDLYAGTGAIGLEALSRGAVALTAVEADRRTASLVRGNAADLGLRAEVVAAKVGTFLAAGPPAEPYDLVYVDPPYSLGASALAETLAALTASPWLSAGATVVVERSARDPEPVWPAGLAPLRRRAYGETVLWYVRAES